MLYSIEIEIPANTNKLLPLRQNLDVVEGVVRKVWVRWRWGSANLCGCRITRWGSPVWPSILNTWFPSSTLDTTFEEAYVLDDEPLEFRIEAYNEDDTYSHKVWIGLLVLRPDTSSNVADFLQFLQTGGG